MPTLTIEDSIQAFLQAGSLGVDDRVYFALAPERPTKPYLVFRVISARPIHTHCGPSNLLHRCYQFDVFSQSQRETYAIANTLRELIDGYSGAVGEWTARIQYENENYFYEQEDKLHRIAQEYGVMYKETA